MNALGCPTSAWPAWWVWWLQRGGGRGGHQESVGVAWGSGRGQAVYGSGLQQPSPLLQAGRCYGTKLCSDRNPQAASCLTHHYYAATQFDHHRVDCCHRGGCSKPCTAAAAAATQQRCPQPCLLLLCRACCIRLTSCSTAVVCRAVPAVSLSALLLLLAPACATEGCAGHDACCCACAGQPGCAGPHQWGQWLQCTTRRPQGVTGCVCRQDVERQESGCV